MLGFDRSAGHADRAVRALVLVLVPVVALAAAAFVPNAARAQEELLGTDLPRRRVEETLETARATRFRPIGPRRLVFEMRMDAPFDAWFVPATHDDADGWRHEIAAYRVARCLGMDNVPPAVMREIARDEIVARLDPDFEDVHDALVARVRWDDRGMATGAVVFRPGDARPSGLDNPRRLERRIALLARRAAVDAGRERLVADLAHAMLFDYLIAYPARFEGAAVPGTPTGSRLFVTSHAGAFVSPLPAEAEQALRARLTRVKKLAPAFVEGLTRCDDARLRAELGAGSPASAPLLLDAHRTRALLDRRVTVVSWIVALRDAWGADTVLSLP